MIFRDVAGVIAKFTFCFLTYGIIVQLVYVTVYRKT